MRLILSLVFIILLWQNNCIAARSKDTSAYFDLMVFIDIDHYAISCRELPLSTLLKKVAKVTEMNNVRSWVVIETDTLTNFLRYRDRILEADTVIWDSNTEMAKRLNLNDLPAVVALNRTKEVLFSYQGQDILLFLQANISLKLRSFNFMKLPGTPLDKTDEGALCKAYLPTINFRDSVLTTLDLPRNAFSMYNVKDGKFIQRVTPNEQVEQFYSRVIAPNLLLSLRQSKYPVGDFDCVVPADRTGKCAPMIVPIKNSGNTVEITYSDTSAERKKSTINDTLDAPRCTGYQGTALHSVYSSVEAGFSPSFLKYRRPYYYCNISYTSPKEGSVIPQDSVPTFYLCQESGAKQGSFFLPIGTLKSVYNLKTYDANTLGVLEYCTARNEFVYLNPWNGIFCAVNSQGIIRKFFPAGILLRSIPTDSSYRPLRDAASDSIKYFVDDVILDSGYCYLLLQPSTAHRSSEYIVVQKYDWSGQLIAETPLVLTNDTFTRAHIAGITRKELYLLAKTRKDGWQLQRLSLK